MSSQTIIGRVGRDPELRYANSGIALCRFSVAVGRSKKVNGEWEETTVWYDLSCFKDIAENAAEGLKKGDEIIAEGYTEEPKTYEKKDGTPGVSLPFVANSLGLSLRWAPAQSSAVAKPMSKPSGKPAAPTSDDEPF